MRQQQQQKHHQREEELLSAARALQQQLERVPGRCTSYTSTECATTIVAVEHSTH
jgi:hypothetical protein